MDNRKESNQPTKEELATVDIKKVTINCDMGEGIANDEALMPYIQLTNIACGYHAGDEDTMKRTIDLALQYGVAIGAHPSYADKENFGRTDLFLSYDEVYELAATQIHTLYSIAKKAGATLHHVKPHGALYNKVARAKNFAAIFALAVKDVDENLKLMGLSGSHSISEAKKIGLKTISEVFCDRTYADDGKLTSRKRPGALIEETDKAVQQAKQMIKEGVVTSTGGKLIPVTAETICIHGDGEHAVVFAKAIYENLKKWKEE